MELCWQKALEQGDDVESQDLGQGREVGTATKGYPGTLQNQTVVVGVEVLHTGAFAAPLRWYHIPTPWLSYQEAMFFHGLTFRV